MAEVSTKEFKLLDEHRVLEGHDAWGPLAIVGTRMLMRDSKKMVCINIGK